MANVACPCLQAILFDFVYSCWKRIQAPASIRSSSEIPSGKIGIGTRAAGFENERAMKIRVRLLDGGTERLEVLPSDLVCVPLPLSEKQPGCITHKAPGRDEDKLPIRTVGSAVKESDAVERLPSHSKVSSRF
jgi:hypothetical protein